MSLEKKHHSAEVKITSSEWIKPELETPIRSIWLSNLDIIAVRNCYTPLFYLYKPNSSHDFFETHRLKSSLSRALVPYYPYAGECRYDEDGRPEVRCNSKGINFLEASCNQTMAEFGDFVPSPTLQSLLFPDTVASADPPCPIVLLQITRFKCSSVCVGIAFHHMVGDGTSSLGFLSAWAAMSHGIDRAAIPRPMLDRGVLKARSPPRVEFEHREYDHCKATTAAPPIPKPTATNIFQLTRLQVAQLKAEGKGATTFAAIVSHAWRSACTARKLSAERPTRVFTMANIRNYTEPRLPASFIGNAVTPLMVEATVGEVVEGSVQRLGRRFEEAKKKQFNDRYIRSQIDFVEAHPRTGRARLAPEDLIAINWLNLPILAFDFGWGMPVYMHRAVLPTCGTVHMVRNPMWDEGSVMVTVSLEEDIMVDFRRIFYELLRPSHRRFHSDL